MSRDERKSKQLDMDEDEIPDSQVPDTELPSSCETFMSQQSESGELSEKQEDKHVEVSDNKSNEISILNSSLEANTSGENVEISLAKKTTSSPLVKSPLEDPRATEEVCGSESEGDMFEEKVHQDDIRFIKHDKRKRKGRSDDSTPSPKKLRREIHDVGTAEEKHFLEPALQEHNKKDISVMEISSTPEKTIVIDDSQEFSLRIDESSPPATQSIGEKVEAPQEDARVGSLATTDPAAAPAVTGSPASSVTTASLSQKSTMSWNSHTNEPNLSWNSHMGFNTLDTAASENKPEREEFGEQIQQLGVSEKDSSLENVTDKNTDSVTVKEVMETLVTLTSLAGGPVAMVLTWSLDSSNKVIAAKIKQLSLLEEYSVEKPGRLSTVSTTSAKSSSSTGSVGLPGPFPLPGKTVVSRLSTVSSTTSSSTASNQAWDGPFLKPQVPISKLNVPFSCDKCGHHFPPVERYISSSPVLNGSPLVEEEESEVKLKPATSRRGRKPHISNSASAVSSGPLEEETSSSGSHAAPQASSTPAKLSRGRPRKQQNGTAHKPNRKVARGEDGVTSARTARSVGRASKNGTPQTPKKVEEGDGEPVLARWGGDGRYYPGWITDPLTASQVLVRFCDGQRKPTAASKVVRASIITPGTLALAATHSGEYEEALVVQVHSNGTEPVYVVERDKTQREVQFPCIALQQATVAELTVSEAQKVTAATNFNDLSLENIIAHPRKRSVRTPVEGGSSGRKKKRQTTPQPCTSHGQTYSGPEENYGDTDSSTHSTCSLDLIGKEIKPLDMECFPPESTRNKLVYSRGNMAYKKKGNSMEEFVVENAGPIPEPDSKLFADCVFLITYTDDVKLGPRNLAYSSIEDTNGAVSNKVLWRDRLRMQIRNGGGKVYNSFNEVTKEELPNTYLITDKQCNTPLYLQCLVNNVPIYSHSVVIQCCAQNRPWREVISSRGVKRMLAGYSLSRKCLVNPRSATPLRGRHILLALSGDTALSTFWQTLITKVGGSVDLYPADPLEDGKYDVVVTDTDCDQELVKEACGVRGGGVPLVSTTWLQQVIVTGEWRSPTEHPLYKYNTSGDGESPEY